MPGFEVPNAEYLSFWGWVHKGWSTFLHVPVLDLDHLEKDTFILQKHSLFFAHFKEIIFIKRDMN